MYLVFRKCIIPIAHDLNNVFGCKITPTLCTAFCKNCTNTITYMVDVEKIKTTTTLESIEVKEKKCPKVDEKFSKLSDVCLPEEEVQFNSLSTLQNGVMDKETCSTDAQNELVTGMTGIDSSSENHDSLSTTYYAEDIKRNLNWIRWVEYSLYAKDLLKSNKWESIQNELITVVSYNVLSQALLEKHRYLYAKHDERSLNWDYRSRVLMEEFESFNADILCLQEVDSSLVNSFYNSNLNRMGYQGVYKQRTNDKVDGCAIYFKKDKFTLLKQKTVELYKEAVRLLDRDNIGIILKLGLKSKPDVEFVVATTHLLYNPKRGDIKLAQTQLMLAEIEKISYKSHNPLTNQPEYLPIIFTGDMNYSPENGVYKLVAKSFLEYQGMSSVQLLPVNRGYPLNRTLLPPKVGVTDSCQFASSLSKREGVNEINFSTGALDHRLNLESVYEHVKGQLPEATTNHKTWITVDYIFYSTLLNKDLNLRTEGNLKLLSRLTLPNTREADTYLKHLPNAACGSDHLPLLATFHLTGN